MWRGLVCGDGPFGCAPVFDLREAWEARRAAAEAQGSNPERPELRHDASLVVTEGQLELLWRLRAAALEGRPEHCCEFVANPRDYPLLLAVRDRLHLAEVIRTLKRSPRRCAARPSLYDGRCGL